MESSAVGECDETEPNALNEAESGAAEANTTQTSKPPKKKSGKAGKPKKKPRLCDVVEQSNEQMKQMQDYIQSSSITSEARSKEREDREFFRQMLAMMSQTMMGMTKMLVQGAGPGYHSPNQVYTSQSVQPNYSFPPSGMGYGFHTLAARPSSSISITSEPTPSEENDYYSF